MEALLNEPNRERVVVVLAVTCFDRCDNREDHHCQGNRDQQEQWKNQEEQEAATDSGGRESQLEVHRSLPLLVDVRVFIALKKPNDYRAEYEAYAIPKRPDQRADMTYCCPFSGFRGDRVRAVRG